MRKTLLLWLVILVVMLNSTQMNFMVYMDVTILILEMRRTQDCWSSVMLMTYWSAVLSSGNLPATWLPYVTGHKSYIDCILIRVKNKQMLVNAKSFLDEECTTQHRLVVSDFRLRTRILHRKLVWKSKIRKLKGPSVRKLKTFYLKHLEVGNGGARDV